MADEVLRRNLDRAFDPGPDFPHRLLVSRAMAVLATEAKIAGRTQDRFRRKTWFRVALPQTGTRLMAALLILLLVVAAAGALLAVNQYIHRSVPVRTHPVSATGTCSQGLQMATAKVGWNGPFPSRTTDGGVTWGDASPSRLPNSTIKWGVTTCALDGDHAWTTQTTGTSTSRPDHVVVFATQNGGQIWQQGESVALRGSETASGPGTGDGSSPGLTRVQVVLDFVDEMHGWLLTDVGPYASPPPVRSIYSSSDGGLHWTLLASDPQGDSSVLGRTAEGCAESGMTFIDANRGWLTWDCSESRLNLPPRYGGPLVAITSDGGHSWASVQLPTFVDVGVCRATPPVFTGMQGVLPVTCGAPGSWGVIYRTGDAGATWSPGRMPFPTELFGSLPSTWSHQLNFVDGKSGWALVPDNLTRSGAADASTSSELYRTTDAGRSWVVVQKGLFPGQLVDSLQFIDASTGFAFTSTPGQTSWKTIDGGQTWAPLDSSEATGRGPLNVDPATPVILFYDQSSVGLIDGMTWDGQVGEVTSMPTDQYATPTSSNPAGTFFFASPNIFDRAGRVVATLPNSGFDLPGTWADDERHYCQIAPIPAGGTNTPTGTFALTGTLQLTTPGGTPRDVAQVGTQDPSANNFTVIACSVLNDEAVVVQTSGSSLSPYGQAPNQYWVVQLSTGHLLWTRDLRGAGVKNLVASRDGRFIAEVQSNAATTIYSNTITAGEASSPSGSEVGHVNGNVRGFSWDGSLAAFGPDRALDPAHEPRGRAGIVRWSTGTVIWTVPAGQAFSFFQPEPGGSRLAILTLRLSSSGVMSGPSVLYVLFSDGHVLAQQEGAYDFLLGCSPTSSGEGGVSCGLPG